MLQWTTAGSGARLGMIVHHDDAVREYAYDRNSSIGVWPKAWTVPGDGLGPDQHEERLEGDLSAAK